MTTVATESQVKELVEKELAANPRAMTIEISRKLNIPEAEVIRALPANQVAELDLGRWEEIIRDLEQFEKMHVVASNGAVTLEAEGQFGGFSFQGPYFNVQTKTLDMHVLHKRIGAIFAVEKPSHLTGVSVYSFQFYTTEGTAAFKAFLEFGVKPLAPERLAMFKGVVGKFKR